MYESGNDIKNGEQLNYSTDEEHFELDKTITKIEEHAFSYFGSKTLTIPDSVVSIGSRAFANFHNIRKITISDSVGYIGPAAFLCCDKLEEVILPKGLGRINEAVFEYCSCLKEIVIPDGVIEIARYAFKECDMLETVILPDTLRFISGDSFFECRSLKRFAVSQNNPRFAIRDGILYNKKLTKLICCPSSITYPVIPDTVTEIADFAFWQSDIREIVLPPSVRKIGRYAFAYCRNLESVVIPEGLREIGRGAFVKCKSFHSVNIPDSVVKLGDDKSDNILIPTDIPTHLPNGVFFDSGLNSVRIGRGVRVIRWNTFRYCPLMQEVRIPDNVAVIEKNAFSGCKMSAVTGANGIISIGESAFGNCKELTAFPFSKSIVRIGEKAFRGCSSLKSAAIHSNLVKLGDGAFSDCCSLRDIETDDVARYIKKDGCIYDSRRRSLMYVPFGAASFIIPDGTKAISPYTFENNRGLKSVTIPGSVKVIGNHAFESCTALETADMENGVRIIGSCAFHNCYALKKADIPDSVRYIGNKAFSECFDMKSLSIGRGVTEIGVQAFSCCRSLTSVEIPDNVKKLRSKIRLCDYNSFKYLSTICNTFSDCYSLESVKIGNGLDRLVHNSFSACSELKELVIGENVRYIRNNFSRIDNLRSLVIPDSVRFIYGSFAYCGKLVSVSLGRRLKFIDGFSFMYWNKKNYISLSMRCDPSENVTDNFSSNYILTRSFEYEYNDYCNVSSVTLEDGIERIGDYAFRSFRSMTDIRIPDSVKEIRDHAFHDCESLNTVILGNSVEYIDEYAFSNCPKLTEIRIPDSVKEIRDHAFSKCEYLNTVILENGLYIDEYAFCDTFINTLVLGKVGGSSSRAPWNIRSRYFSYNLRTIKLHPDDISIERDHSERDVLIFGRQLSAVLNAMESEDENSYFDPAPDPELLYILATLKYLGDRDQKVTDFINANKIKLLREFISHGDIQVIERFTEEEGFFTAENITEAIDIAVEYEQSEMAVMLTSLRAEKLGFDSVSDRFQLL